MFQVMESAKRELRHLRSEGIFDELFEHVSKAAEDGKVHPMEPPRYRRRLTRHEKGSTSDVPNETRVHFRHGNMPRYQDTDFNEVMSRVRLLHEEDSDLSSLDDVAAIIRNMYEATRQYFKKVESIVSSW
ncbi:hypothetical protein HPB50_024825 [Hyalomma asiaticum]|uniref:Uncharacterized protein n=1 Tax=Hyalomma asiaticum TaxID=266040 RepID=A0ACB7TQT4_HYAAI|nr:hypothetical protein HPB50_024825 [Hyalomma asiaticum]